MWNTVSDTKTIGNLMHSVGFFHDSCIKEIRYISGAYVDKEQFMQPTNLCRKLSVIIQTQKCDTPIIELEFSKLKILRLVPLDDRYTCEIQCSTLLLEHGLFYWFDCDGMSSCDIDRYNGITVCAEELRWRVINVALEDQEFFVKRTD